MTLRGQTMFKLPHCASLCESNKRKGNYSSNSMSSWIGSKFAEKVEDLVGLYMDPPAHADVVSIDEKSQYKLSIVPNRACRSNPASAGQ
jgi:hypothetical protein